MKKLLFILMIMVITSMMIACNDKTKESSKSSGEATNLTSQTTNTTETTTSPNPLSGEKESDAQSQSGDAIVIESNSGENIVVEPGANKENGENTMKEINTDPKRYENVERNPIVTIEMKNGKKITVELYPKIAPTSVENFISLINKNFYDGVIFHRVMPNFMAQGGDPQGTGLGGPGYTIQGEFSENGFTQNNLKHDIGVISMARATDPNSAGSQFFIVTSDQSYVSLDGKYAGFGKVVDGMDVVYEIVNSEVNFSTEELNKVYEKIMSGEEPDNSEIALIQAYQSGQVFDRPINPPVIKTMTVDTFGVEYQEPVKIEK